MINPEPKGTFQGEDRNIFVGVQRDAFKSKQDKRVSFGIHDAFTAKAKYKFNHQADAFATAPSGKGRPTGDAFSFKVKGGGSGFLSDAFNASPRGRFMPSADAFATAPSGKGRPTGDAFSFKVKGGDSGFLSDAFNAGTRGKFKPSADAFATAPTGKGRPTGDAFSFKVKGGGRKNVMGDAFIIRQYRESKARENDAFSNRPAILKKTATADAFSVKQRRGGNDAENERSPFNVRWRDSRNNLQMGDAFAMKTSSVRQHDSKDAFSVKIKSKSKSTFGGDAFSVNTRVRQSAEFRGDAFSVKISNRRQKSADEHDAFTFRKHKQEYELKDAFADKRRYSGRKTFKGERRKLFIAGLGSRKKKHDAGGDAFTLSPRKQKKEQEKRRRKKEMGLFENAVIRK